MSDNIVSDVSVDEKQNDLHHEHVHKFYCKMENELLCHPRDKSFMSGLSRLNTLGRRELDAVTD